MVNACTLQQNQQPCFNCPTIQCQDYAKRNTVTDTMEAQGHQTYTCATENPELGIFQTGKQMIFGTCLEIFMIKFFLIQILYAESRQNTQPWLLPSVGNEYDKKVLKCMLQFPSRCYTQKNVNSKYFEDFFTFKCNGAFCYQNTAENGFLSPSVPWKSIRWTTQHHHHLYFTLG